MSAVSCFRLNEPRRRVRYDFDALAANRFIRSAFYWSKDVVEDWRGTTHNIRAQVAELNRLIETELASGSS